MATQSMVRSEYRTQTHLITAALSAKDDRPAERIESGDSGLERQGGGNVPRNDGGVGAGIKEKVGGQ